MVTIDLIIEREITMTEEEKDTLANILIVIGASILLVVILIVICLEAGE